MFDLFCVIGGRLLSTVNSRSLGGGCRVFCVRDAAKRHFTLELLANTRKKGHSQHLVAMADDDNAARRRSEIDVAKLT